MSLLPRPLSHNWTVNCLNSGLVASQMFFASPEVMKKSGDFAQCPAFGQYGIFNATNPESTCKKAASRHMKLANANRCGRQDAFTLAEVVIASGLAGIMFLAGMTGFSSGFN